MRLLLLLFFLSVRPTQAHAQAAFEKEFSNTLCKCLDSTQADVANQKDNMTNCLVGTLEQYKKEITEECLRLYNDTTEEIGYQYGTLLMERNMVSLVNTCHSYFILIDSLRYIDFKTDRPDTVRAHILTMENDKSLERKGRFHFELAKLYFMVKEYASARGQITIAIEKEPKHYGYLYMLGWLNEIEKRYDDAIRLYDQVAENTQQNLYRIFSELAKKKKSKD